MTYYFIVNPGSRTGKGVELWQQLADRLDESGVEYEALFTEGPGDATRLAEKICREHPENKRIVLVGGDGTADEAVNGLSGYESITLGLIPTGSGNDLAAGLGIPMDPMQALENVIHPGNFRMIDHGAAEFADMSERELQPEDLGAGCCKDPALPANCRKFAVSAGIGYDADICYEAEHSKLKGFLNKIHLGKLIYYLLGVKLIFTNKRAKAVITVDGQRTIKTDKLLFVAAMNTLYEGGGMPMAPEADPSDGRISICVLHDVSRFGHMKLMPTILNATHIKHEGVDVLTGRVIEVKTDRPLVVHTDGEYAGRHDHIKFYCTPGQIRMML